MKIICFANLKGGTGKTTNAFNIAGVLAQTQKVLVIDVDPQSNMTADMNFDLNEIYFDETPSVKDIFADGGRQLPPESIVQKNRISELPNLDIIPSSIYLFEIEDVVNARLDRPLILARYIEDNRSFFEAYDYVIIDTNPSMSIFNVNAFLVADSIILNSDTSNNSMMGAVVFRRIWEKKCKALRVEDNVNALIVSNYQGASDYSKAFLEYITKTKSLTELTCKTYISRTDKIKEGESAHKPVCVMKKDRAVKRACAQYKALINELKDVEVL